MAGNDRSVPGVVSGRAPDTGSTLSQPPAIPVPPREPAWDITFTRLVRAAGPPVDACMRELALRFQALGLDTDVTVRLTPRGLSTYLALVGRRGLVCIVELTLVDGMAVGQGPCAVLDIRLLDACGDVVADGLAAEALGPQNLERAATTVYVAALAQFDLLRPATRHA